MATYEINGAQFEAPDDMPTDKVYQIATSTLTSQQTGGSTQAPQNTTKIDPDDLKYDQQYLNSAATWYNAKTGKDWEGKDPDELADYGQSEMSFFNNNLMLGTAPTAALLKDLNTEQKKAFLYMLETHDRLDYSWKGTGRALAAMAEDPTNWVGLGTLGVGTAAGQGAGAVAKLGIKAALRAVVVSGVEGSIYGATADALRQRAEINADGRDQMDLGQVATSAAVTGALSAGLGGATRYALDLLPKTAARPSATPVERPDVQLTPQPKEVAPLGEEARTASPEAVPIEEPAATPSGAAEAPKSETGAPVAEEGVKPVSEAPEGLTGNKVLDALVDYATKNKLDTPEALAEHATNVLADIKPEDVTRMAEQVKQWGVNGAVDGHAIAGTIRDLSQSLIDKTREINEQLKTVTDEGQRVTLDTQLQQIERLRSVAVQADASLSTETSRELGSRVGLTNTTDNRALTPEKILAETMEDPSKATPEQYEAARQEVYRRYDQVEQQAKQDAQVQKLDQVTQDLFDKGDMAGSVRASADKAALQTVVAEQAAKEQGLGTTLLTTGNTITQGLIEATIGNVMSPATITKVLTANTFNTMVRPLLDFLARGGDYAAYRQMAGTYGAMVSAFHFAAQSAAKTWEWETHFLTTDQSRWFEKPDNIIPRKYGGGVVRVLPRMIETMDEFFKQITYRGYVTGDAIGSAIREGFEKGMSHGPELEAFVNDRVQSATDNLFKSDIDAPKVIDFLRRQGLSDGKSGEVLDQWIQIQLEKHSDLFKEANSQIGKNYSDDILNKRAFSGQSNISKAALGYENVINQYPIMRLMGQMFFKTPIRVLEQEIQYTPGLNMMSSLLQPMSTGFIHDLRGVNGEYRQTKALGAAMASYAFASLGMLTYASGALQGGGPDKTAERRGQAAGDFNPYSLSLPDGSKLGINRLEPASGPLKVLANVFERYGDLSRREMQGEFVGKEKKDLESFLRVFTMSIAGMLHDSGSFDGFTKAADAINITSDPVKGENRLDRYIGQTLTQLIPHTYINTMKTQHPEINDPVSWDQFLKAAINPTDPTVSKQYDSLGNVRQAANPMSSLTGIDLIYPQQRLKGQTQRDMDLNSKLAEIESISGTTFMPKHTVDYPGFDVLKGKDLRTALTPDGKNTYMNAWMDEYRNSGVKDDLEKLLNGAEEKIKIGSPSEHKEFLAGAVGKLLEEHRKASFERMMDKQQELFSTIQKSNQLRMQRIQQPDVMFNPYK